MGPDDAGRARVLEHVRGPLLVVGAGGTGRTTLMVDAAVARVRDRGLDPRRVLVLTFSRQAARRLADRIAARLPGGVTGVPVFSVHGFCHEVFRRAHGAEPWRVLTAPEQELRLREILAGSRAPWPADVAEAVGTRAFARDLRALLARARQLGLDPADLADRGRTADRPEWVRAAALFEEYLDVLDLERVVDYDEMVHRVRILLADPASGEGIRARWDAVFVDDLQDAVPAHLWLLRALVPPTGAAELVAAGDPDQSVFGFRGADPRAVRTFPALFADPAGRAAPVVVLGEDHRHADAVAAVVAATTGRMPQAAGLPGRLVPDPVRGRTGRAEAVICPGPRGEAAAVAARLWLSHEEDGVPWGRMAVIVRTRGPEEAALRRRLERAGIPLVPADDTALSHEPAVRVLLDVLRCALADPDRELPDDLLRGPLGQVDAMDLRRHRRALAAGSDGLPRVAERIERVRAAVAACAKVLAEGGSAVEALWAAWDGTDWPRRLRRQATGSGPDIERADRDLDAVLALFDFATRAGDRRGRPAAEDLLDQVEGQAIPADVRGSRRIRRDRVELVTAHRCGEGEWDLVAICGLQEGTWPALGRPGGLLALDRMGPDGPCPPASVGELVAEERRLFHRACGRARDVLILTAVEDPRGETGLPSRFLAETGCPPVPDDPRAEGPSADPSTLVPRLRAVGADPAVSPSAREQAAYVLARLAPISSARPEHWWAARERTRANRPLAPRDEPVHVSGSWLDALLRCPLRWFLERRAGATRMSGDAAAVGTLVHALIRRASEASIDAADLRAAFETAWEEVPPGPPWRAEARRMRVWSMVQAWQQWHAEQPAEWFLGAEVAFRCEVAVPDPAGGTDRVLLTGSVDRLETVDGTTRVVDYKTGRRASAREVASMGQFGVYQEAVLAGAFDAVPGANRAPGGARAVYLDAGEGSPKAATVLQPSVLDVPVPADTTPVGAGDWVLERLAEAAALLRSESIEARPGPHCRGCPVMHQCPVGGETR